MEDDLNSCYQNIEPFLETQLDVLDGSFSETLNIKEPSISNNINHLDCVFCHKSFPTLEEHDAHSKEHIVVHLENENEEKTLLADNASLQEIPLVQDKLKVRLYICMYCNETFRQKKQYKEHIDKHNKLFKCQNCDRHFKTAYHLKRHEVTHIKTKMLRCSRCSKTFRTEKNLNLHEDSHLHVTAKKEPITCNQMLKENSHLDLVEHIEKSEQNKSTEEENMHLRRTVINRKPRLTEIIEEAKPENKGRSNLKQSIETEHPPSDRTIKNEEPNYNDSNLDERPHKGNSLDVDSTWVCETILVQETLEDRYFICFYCNERFTQKKQYIEHIDKHNKIFKCRNCDRNFKTAYHLQRHEVTHNKIIMLQCSTCSKTFRTEENLNLHEESHLHVTVKKEPLSCDEILNEISHLDVTENIEKSGQNELTGEEKVHLGRTVIIKKTRQSKIIKEVKSENNGSSHLKESVEIKPPLLDKTVKNEKLNSNHSISDEKPHHAAGIENQEVEVSGESSKNELNELSNNNEPTKTKGNKRKVKKTLKEEKPETELLTSILKVECGLCWLPFPNEEHLQVHQETLTCNECKKCFRSESYLKKHLATVHKIGSYICDICSKGCKTKQQLEIHKTVHSDLKPHICNLCLKAFSTKYHLNAHQKFHDDTRKFICDTCGKMFKLKQQLQHHELIHEDIRDFICDRCDKSFRFKQALENHVKTHNNYRPFPCSLCDKSFKTKQQLTNHLIQHSGLKIHICEECNKSFTFKQQLQVHLKIHFGIKEFECSLCEKQFRTKQQLDVHQVVHDKSDD